ncbi:MAG TPA: hypothetical protein VGP96_04295 [Candidatus Dormibacteraeota bacterium]|jgi:hypothetical protein|nr:hypothetical protein [Candidatus Dormibacteraeota bacterium]
MPHPGHDARRRRLVARVAAGTAIAGAAAVAGLSGELALATGPVSPSATAPAGGTTDPSGAPPPPIVTAPS